jgi:radical SAM superfamily enzyme YgiQ (UPF0313 family)
MAVNVNGKRPKVVLFHPHYQAGNYNTNQRQPLDLLSISGFPEQNGYEVVVIDASVTPDYRERVLEECEGALCFGTTSIIGYQVYHSYSMAREVKERYPSLPVVAGGWFPSMKPEMVLEQGGANVVVIRQGELTFMELLEALRSGSSLVGIEGLAYREDGGGVVFNPMRKIEDLNKMPPMPYHLIDFEDYFASDPYERAKHFLYIATGRDFSSTQIRALDYFSSYGCPDACTFCSSPVLTERRWTALEAGRIINELDHLVKKHHFNVLTFCDANWGVSEKRVFEFCEGLLKKGISIYWAASVEAHVINKFDPKVVDLMAKSGCVGLLIGAEAAYPPTIEWIKKNIKPGDILRCCEICCERGIIPEASYIVGYPGESVESIQATIEEGCELVYRWPQVELPIRLYLPIPGTPLHERAVELGYEPVTSIDDWAGYQNYQTELYSSISPKQLKTIRRCQRYYFWWGSERLKLGKKLNFIEKLLHKSARIRLKYKWLGFPIEFKLLHILRRLPRSIGLH